MESHDFQRSTLASLREPDETRVPEPTTGSPAQQRPGGLFAPDGREPELRPREVPLQEVGIIGAGPVQEDAGVDATGERQTRLRQEVPGAERVGVLAVAHEDGARFRVGKSEEVRERSQEEDVLVAVGEVVAGENGDVDQLEGQRVGLPELPQGGPAGEKVGDALVRRGARHEVEIAQPCHKTGPVLRGQRTVLVNEQGERFRRVPQQAPEAGEGHLHVSVAQEGGDPHRFAHPALPRYTNPSIPNSPFCGLPARTEEK
jgi:hypothetical protein